MIKILMTGVSNIGKAGVATISYNLGQNLDNEEIEIGYLAQRGLPPKKYIDAIKRKGNKIYAMDSVPKGMAQKTKHIINWVYTILKSDGYDAIHINTDTAYLAAVYLWIAKKAGIKYIIVHSHSDMVDENSGTVRKIKILLHRALCPYVRRNADIRLACSAQAGEWLFGKEQFTVIPNGIDIDRFQYNEEARSEYRKQMELEDQFVIVTVGRIAYPKKPCFTADIFAEIARKVPESTLLFVGDGPLREEVQEHIRSMGMEKKVRFLGNRDDVPQLLSAADVFLLPSLFEGLGIVYIEAQASGMPVFASDQVPKEAFVSRLIHRVPLSDTAGEWAEQIIQHRGDPRVRYVNEIAEHGYDIKGASKALEKEYLKLAGIKRQVSREYEYVRK